MFSNLFYFLIALVIYTTSELFDAGKGFDPHTSLVNGLIFTAVFMLVCSILFKRLEKKAAQSPYANMDQYINNTISRLSILALVIFAVNIYTFKLPHVFSGNRFFDLFPTFEAIVFLGLFLVYLIFIWNAAYGVQKRYFAGQVSRRDYILSNVSFSLPALLPWFCLSMAADMIGLLPWPPLREFMQSPAGEISYIALFLVGIAVFGPVFIRRLWNCRPLEPGEARNRIEAVCQRAGLKYSNVLRWDLFGGTMITAGVMGLVGRFRYILVTPALLSALNPDELDAVMLHEIGHVQKYHMVFYLAFFAGFIACNFVFFEPIMMLLYVLEPAYTVFSFMGVERGTVHPILISATLIGFFVIYFRFVFGFFMRNFERQADLHVFRFGTDASPLISTFYKIASFSRQSMDKPNWHHYSIGQRIRFLETCRKNPALVAAHHSRVKKMMVGYFMVIILVVGMGYSINYGRAGEAFNNFIAGKILFRQMEVEPENSDLYVLVGDYYYSKKKYQEAIDSYENVLRVDPDNVHALNNLSWLFATCPDPAFRNGEKALENALKAVGQKREAFVLDTYAEALFINNEKGGALRAAREALEVSTDKRDYYERRLALFEKGLTP